MTALHATDVRYYLSSELRGDHEGLPRWVGEGSRWLGLAGVPGEAALRDVISGLDPANGEILRRRSARGIAAFDCTFAAPKGVSLWGALGDDERARSTLVAHDRAVQAAFAYLEHEVLHARRTVAGSRRSVPVRGPALSVLHVASRSGDPHVHTHLLVANLGRASDGRWGALDSRALFSHARTLGALYHAHLRYELGELGVGFGPLRSGVAAPLGVPAHLLEAASSRRTEVLSQAREWASTSERGRRAAALATRERKPAPRSLEAWRARWREALGPVLDPEREPAHAPFAQEASAVVVKQAMERLEEAGGWFRRCELIGALCEGSPAGSSASSLLELADGVLESSAVRRTTLEAGPEPWWLSARTAPEEAQLVQSVRQALQAPAGSRVRASTGPLAPGSQPGGARSGVPGARDVGAWEQAVVVLAAPGMVEGAPEVAALRLRSERAGARVLGIAPAAPSAASWQAVTGVSFCSAGEVLAAPHLLREPTGSQDAGPGRTVVVAGAEQLDARMLRRALAEARGGQLVLVTGRLDSRQPGAARLRSLGAPVVEPAPLSPGRGGTYVLDVGAVRVSLSADPRALGHAVLGEFWEALRTGVGPVMVTPDRALAGVLTASARSLLREVGAIGESRRVGGIDLAPGDRVRALRPPPGTPVGRPEALEVLSVERAAVVLSAGGGTTLRLSALEVRASRLHHAYAVTPGEAARLPVGVAIGVGVSAEALAQDRRGVERVRSLHVVAGGEVGLALAQAGACRLAWSEITDRALAEEVARDAVELAAPVGVEARLGPPPKLAGPRGHWRAGAVAIARLEGAIPPRVAGVGDLHWRAEEAAALRRASALMPLRGREREPPSSHMAPGRPPATDERPASRRIAGRAGLSEHPGTRRLQRPETARERGETGRELEVPSRGLGR